MPDQITINILTGLAEAGAALERYLRFTVAPVSVKLLRMGEATALSQDTLAVDIWIAEAWNITQADNPEGFRTAMKLAGVCRFLLLFMPFLPAVFPEEGPFWTTYCNQKPLSKKIDEVLSGPVPKKEDYKKLIDLWPALGSDPASHHHHSARRNG